MNCRKNKDGLHELARIIDLEKIYTKNNNNFTCSKTCSKLVENFLVLNMFLQKFSKTKKSFQKNVKTCSKLLTFEHLFYIVLNMRIFSENFVIFKTL